MQTTERITRSRARTMATGGETPSLAEVPSKTPATRTTRRRAAAAAATAPPAAAPAPVPAEQVQPVVLFDVTNDQDAVVPAAEPAAEDGQALASAEASLEMLPAAEPSAEGSRPTSPLPPADEPPTTPAHAVPTSPAPPVPGATPTGLGLSTLPPLSPTLPTALQAGTPAATPTGGVAGSAGRVTHALQAAVQALGGVERSPVPSPVAAPAEHAGAEPELVFRGFGSPLKPEADSPKADSPEAMVSIGAAIPPTSALRGATPGFGAAAGGDEADATSAPTVDFRVAEREITLEDMMGSPPASECEEAPEASPSPAMAGAPTLAAATPGAAAVPRSAAAVRTAPRTHPLTPSRQAVLEEEEQDFIMQTEEDQAAAMFSEEALAAAAEPSPVPQQPAARVQSKVVVPSPHTYDPRSLRQLRREVSDRLAEKQAAVPRGLDGEDEEEDEEEYIGAVAGSEELTGALDALSLEPGVHHGLRGLPTPVGSHIRFDDDGEVAGESPRQRVYLRGLPQPQGAHIHFDD